MVHRDSGAAAARTSLAWQRTTAATVLGIALLLRMNWSHLDLVTIALLVVATGLAVTVILDTRTKSRDALHHESTAGLGRSLALSGAVCALACIECYVVLMSD